MRDASVSVISGDSPGLPGGDVLFGSTEVTDPHNMHLTLEELRQEAWEQPWDTNGYFYLANSDTRSAVVILGPPTEVLGPITETMKGYLESISWTAFYMEGYMPRFGPQENPSEAMARATVEPDFPKNKETEYRGFMFLSPTHSCFVIRFRAEERWRLVAVDDEVYDPYHPFGSGALQVREEMGW